MEHLALIEEILKGNTAAFATIIDRYKDSVFSLAARMADSNEDAEEIVQDVFLKVYENLSSFQGQAKFSTWLYRIAYNTTISKLRSVKKFQNEMSVDEYSFSESLEVEQSLEYVSHKEQKYFIQKALEELKPEERAVVELFYLEELKVEEIVEITGESKSAIKVKLHRLRKKLHDILSQQLGEEKQALYKN